MMGPSQLAAEFWRAGKSAACPIYDLHGHMGPKGTLFMPRAEAPEMIRTMDGCGMRLLVFSHHLALRSPDIGNAPAVEAVRRYPDRLRAYCVINPHYPHQVEADLASFAAHSDVYLGLKLHADWHGLPITHARYQPAWEYADRHGLLLLAHTRGDSAYSGPQLVRQMAERYPKVRFILGHSFMYDWDAAVHVARDFPNAYLDLCGPFFYRGVLEKFVGEVGSDRLLFGTDMPWFDPHQAIGSLMSADIGDDDRHNICHRNAEKLLRSIRCLPPSVPGAQGIDAPAGS